MLAHMKKPLTKVKRPITRHSVARKINSRNTMIYVSCPASNADRIKLLLEKHGCICIDDKNEWSDAKGLFAERTSSNMLIGARGKENITQIQLSELTGIPRRHISDMENGRRPIGKQNAIKLGKALNINYRLFL
jgi:DNA-binding XRE family transcriptional regulator